MRESFSDRTISPRFAAGDKGGHSRLFESHMRAELEQGRAFPVMLAVIARGSCGGVTSIPERSLCRSV